VSAARRNVNNLHENIFVLFALLILGGLRRDARGDGVSTGSAGIKVPGTVLNLGGSRVGTWMERPDPRRFGGWTADTSNPDDVKLGFGTEDTSLAKAVVIDALLSCVVASGAKRSTAMHQRQRTVATAVAYFWRFYLSKSFASDEPVAVIVACLSLAGKVLENPVHDHTKFSKLAQAVARAVYGQETEPTKENAQGGSQSTLTCDFGPESLLPHELVVLDAVKTNLAPYDPHFALVELLGDDGGRTPSEGEVKHNDNDNCATTSEEFDNENNKNELFKLAWAILNDSLVTNLCVSVSERGAAFAAIAVACELLDTEPPSLRIPESDLRFEKENASLAAREMMRYRGLGDFAERAATKGEIKTPQVPKAHVPVGWRERPLMLVGRRAEAAEIIRAARKTQSATG
jgi:hypothetical protein